MIKTLKKSDKGRVVVFVSKSSDGAIYKKDVGVIKDFDNESKLAFVVYNCAGNYKNYEDYTGAGTLYEDLYLTSVNIKTIGEPNK